MYKMILILVLVVVLLSACGGEDFDRGPLVRDKASHYYARCYSNGTLIYEGHIYQDVLFTYEADTDQPIALSGDCVFTSIKDDE